MLSKRYQKPHAGRVRRMAAARLSLEGVLRDGFMVGPAESPVA